MAAGGRWAEKHGQKATTDAEGPFTTVKGPSETVHADHQIDEARGIRGHLPGLDRPPAVVLPGPLLRQQRQALGITLTAAALALEVA